MSLQDNHHHAHSTSLPHSPTTTTSHQQHSNNNNHTPSSPSPPSSARRRKTTKSSAEFQFVLAKYGLSANGELQASYLQQQQQQQQLSTSLPMNNTTNAMMNHHSLPSSLSSIPQIVKSGHLMKQGIKWRSWKKRYFILVDDILIYKSEVDAPVIGLLQLQNGSVSVDEKNKRMFHVKCEKSFSKDKIYSERSYTFQICSEDHEEEREDWVQKVKRAATQHVRSRMRTRTRANGGAAGSSNSLMSDRSTRTLNTSQNDSQNGVKGVESRKIVAIVVTNATSNIGMEVVKSLLLRKIRVIAVCHPTQFIPQTSSNNNDHERKGSFNTVSKEELLKNYGAIVIRLENGFRRFEEASLVEQIKEKQYHISCVVHIPLDHEYIVEDMNQVINFALQLSVDSFFLCSRYYTAPSSQPHDSFKSGFTKHSQENSSNEEHAIELPELFHCHLQCEQMVKTYFGHSCGILRCNGTMQDFLLFYDEKTRTFYFPFGDLKDSDDESKKRVSWVDARDVGLSVCSMIMNIMFQVSSTMSSQPPKPPNAGLLFISQSHASTQQQNEKKHRTTYTLTGPESLTIKDVITKFSKKTNVPVEYKIIDREQSIHRLMLSKGLRKWECDAYHDMYTRIYDAGLAMAVYPDVQDIKKSAPTPFDSFIERELETFQDHNPCVCMIGSIHFIQSKLLHALHEKNYLSKNIIFSKKEIPDYPFKTAQYIVFDYEKEKKSVESKVRIEVMEEVRKRRTEEIIAQSGMLGVPFKASRSASFHDIESDDLAENRIKGILQEKFIDIVSDAVIQCEKLIFFIKAKYLLNKWFDAESFKKVIDNSQRSTKLKHIILLYDSATKRICPEFLTKISIYLSMKCKTAYTMVEFGWLYQTLATLSGSEIQTYSSLSIPVSSTIDVLNDRLEWCDGDDVIEFILHLLQNIKLDSEQIVKNFVCHGTKASFREIARLMHEVLKKPVSCSAIDISKSFPCLFIDNKDLFEHRAIKKEMVYYLTMVKEDPNSIENYSTDCLAFETVMGKPLKTLKEFFEESLLMFADIIELNQCEFDFFQEMSACTSIDEQELVIFKHLMNRIKNPTSLFHRVVKQKSRQFLSTYSQDYYHSLTTEEKLIVISRAKSLIASFFDEMYRVLARQVMKIIIPQAADYGVMIKVDPNQMEPLFSQCIDHVFFDQVFPLVFELYKREYSVKSEIVNQKYVELAKCTPKHLEIADEYCLDGNGKSAEENYSLAIESLRNISQCNSLVEGKMKLLMETSKAIVECVKIYHGREREVSADALMPIFIFVLIKASIPDLYCQFKILEDFVHESIMMGPMGYSLVTLQIAIDYMQTLQWEQLDQMFQIQMDLKRQQVEFQRQRDSEIQLRKTRGFSVMLNAPPPDTQQVVVVVNKFAEEIHIDDSSTNDDYMTMIWMIM
ncbi:hypothetical protein C9374_007249 [Naegleria lovaniensis]|uniref:PH domain-containing protein n=1 Tax=Naegleria lovaniensis TaxID=51637 RepID=A0AA88H376_NAELO|nr:uncharacterized protein C9374_007249 [Naegleria lovaniensis]KAG2393718.1 hypothetical protein C9374_007249 [Naegleria lovaniensis]